MNKNHINLDISQYNSKEKLNEMDCGWYNLETVKIFRDELCKNLIPIIKIKEINEKINPNINLAVNIFFKWFAGDLLELFSALQTKKYLSKKYDEIHVPNKFFFLDQVLKDEIPKTRFQKL